MVLIEEWIRQKIVTKEQVRSKCKDRNFELMKCNTEGYIEALRDVLQLIKEHND